MHRAPLGLPRAAGKPSTLPRFSQRRMDLSNPGMSITELSAAETILYSECVERIAKGPARPEAIGEALWRIQEQRLYRDKVGDMYTFLCTCTKIEPEEGLKVIDAWKLSPPGQAVVSADLGVDGGEDGLAADEPIDWNPPPRVRKATFTTPAPDSAKECRSCSRDSIRRTIHRGQNRRKPAGKWGKQQCSSKFKAVVLPKPGFLP